MLLHCLQRLPLIRSSETSTLIDLRTLPEYKTIIRAAGHAEFFADLEKASFYIGAELSPVLDSPPPILKTTEAYVWRSKGASKIYLERWSLMINPHFCIPYKIRYRTETQILKNLVILAGVDHVAQSLFRVEANQERAWSEGYEIFTSPELYLLRLLLKELPSHMPLSKNVGDVLLALEKQTHPSVFSFSEEHYDTLHVIKSIDRTLIDDIPTVALDWATSPGELIKLLEGTSPVAEDGFIRMLARGFTPPFVDSITWRYLSNPSKPIPFSLFSKALVGSPSEVTPFHDSSPPAPDPRITVAGAHLNDVRWLPFVTIFQRSALTDVVLSFCLSLDPFEMFLNSSSGVKNRFAPGKHLDAEVNELSSLIINCFATETVIPPSETLFDFDGGVIELVVTRTFDERLTLDFHRLDDANVVVRHDVIDLALMPLMCYGLAGQLLDM